MTDFQTIRVFAKGGVVSPGDLLKLCRVAGESGCETIGLGSRQEIFLRVPASKIPAAIDGLVDAGLPFEAGMGQKNNIVTSYAAMGIHPATPWLLADTYLDILEQFAYQPRLKINITDPQQPLVPRFSGELNFIASAYPTFWHLHLQLPALGSNGHLWPVLVGSDDIARLSYVLEQECLHSTTLSLSELVERVTRQFPDATTRPYTQAFAVPQLPFPEYEGFHPSEAGYWVGIFRRDFAYPLAFVEELSEVALRSKIGKICLTPWKTLLIKDIRAEYRGHWEKLLGTHRISIHHAASELNWQVPDDDEAALTLKKQVVKQLEEWECTTVGLSFAIRTQPMPVATSVVIEPEKEPGAPTFSIRRTADFSRSNSRWRVFARQVPASGVAEKLRELCGYYYASVDHLQRDLDPEPALPADQSVPAAHVLYQCTHCLTIYHPEFGDAAFGVPTGVPFTQLPDHYTCSVCEGYKEDFVLVDESIR